jgi:hypothetical protein
MKSVIYIDREGNLHGLADDLIDRLNLGKKKIFRVSNVEYDHERGVWVATDLDTGKEIASHKIRSKVIDMEREYFNKRLEEQFSRL